MDVWMANVRGNRFSRSVLGATESFTSVHLGITESE
jgi:hypothetical protein